MILLVVGLNTRVYVEDWNIISHFDTNEICFSLFDKYDLFLSAKGVEFYVEDWKIVSHFDTNEVCVSLFDKFDLYLSANGVEFYVED